MDSVSEEEYSLIFDSFYKRSLQFKNLEPSALGLLGLFNSISNKAQKWCNLSFKLTPLVPTNSFFKFLRMLKFNEFRFPLPNVRLSLPTCSPSLFTTLR